MGAPAAAAEDLEALFEQVAAQSAAARGEAALPASRTALRAVEVAATVAVEGVASVAVEGVASVAVEGVASVAVEGVASVAVADGTMFHRVGQLTRTLHDALRELGYDRNLASAVQDLPDARDRLNYIATLTGQAAERVLGAVERGQAAQRGLTQDSAQLAARWEELYAGALSIEEFKALAGQTRGFLRALPQRTGDIDAQLHEIMMAQDFHDLTGQVIGRVVSLAQSLEAQLVALLLDARPESAAQGDARVAAAQGGAGQWLTGPAINAAGRSDVVANQAQVDELLDSLGF